MLPMFVSDIITFSPHNHTEKGIIIFIPTF